MNNIVLLPTDYGPSELSETNYLQIVKNDALNIIRISLIRNHDELCNNEVRIAQSGTRYNWQYRRGLIQIINSMCDESNVPFNNDNQSIEIIGDSPQGNSLIVVRDFQGDIHFWGQPRAQKGAPLEIELFNDHKSRYNKKMRKLFLRFYDLSLKEYNNNTNLRKFLELYQKMDS